MDIELDLDPLALATYHIILAALKHPTSHQNEEMRLLTRTQVEWVLEALQPHALIFDPQWDEAKCLVEVQRRGGASARVSFLFPLKSSRSEQEAQARATSNDDTYDDNFKREPI